jgi:hypothetical protein
MGSGGKAGMLYRINTMIKNETSMKCFSILHHFRIGSEFKDLARRIGSAISVAQALLWCPKSDSRQIYALVPVRVGKARQ